MEYKIVHGDDEDELTTKVNEAMKEGWRAQGGVSVLINTFTKTFLGGETPTWEPYAGEFHQAMIKTGFRPVDDWATVPVGVPAGAPADDPVSELGW